MAVPIVLLLLCIVSSEDMRFLYDAIRVFLNLKRRGIPDSAILIRGYVINQPIILRAVVKQTLKKGIALGFTLEDYDEFIAKFTRSRATDAIVEAYGLANTQRTAATICLFNHGTNNGTFGSNDTQLSPQDLWKIVKENSMIPTFLFSTSCYATLLFVLIDNDPDINAVALYDSGLTFEEVDGFAVLLPDDGHQEPYDVATYIGLLFVNLLRRSTNGAEFRDLVEAQDGKVSKVHYPSTMVPWYVGKPELLSHYDFIGNGTIEPDLALQLQGTIKVRKSPVAQSTIDLLHPILRKALDDVVGHNPKRDNIIVNTFLTDFYKLVIGSRSLRDRAFPVNSKFAEMGLMNVKQTGALFGYAIVNEHVHEEVIKRATELVDIEKAKVTPALNELL